MLGKDWKSSASGILTFLVTTLTTLSAFLVAGNINDSGTGASSIHVSTWVVVGINAALALCRAWIGLITTNADAGAVAVALAPLVPPTPSPAGTLATVQLPTATTLAATPKTP